MACHHTCRTCNSSNSDSDCVTCYDYASKNDNGSCICNDGFYAIESSDPCNSRPDTPCTVCMACDSSCLTCTGSGIDSIKIFINN